MWELPYQMPHIPTSYIPAVGDIIYARRSAGDDFKTAIVIHKWWRKTGALEIKIVWLESNPEARVPIVAGAVGWIKFKPWPPLIKKYDRS